MKNLNLLPFLTFTILSLMLCLVCTSCRELPTEHLTLNESSGKFVPIFNGRDLTGWKYIKGGTWKVKDGILFTEGDNKGWLSTVRQYDNFILVFEFRVPKGGNSGVFVHIPRDDGDRPAYTGMEIQILDDYAPRWANCKPEQYTGSIYDVKAPSKRLSKKANIWQKMVIVCDGPVIKVFLNDVLVVDTNINNHKDKWEKHPGLKRTKGHIGLQHHNTKIEFRNINIRQIK